MKARPAPLKTEKTLRRFFRKMPAIETERLRLRPMQQCDAADLFAYARLPAVTKYLLWNAHPDLAHTKRYLKAVEKAYRKGRFFEWAITQKKDGKMVGTCGFSKLSLPDRRGEIGYVLHPDLWGKGLAAEAARAVLAFGFERLQLHRIEGRYMAENLQSRRVMEKAGMHHEGVFRDALFHEGSFRDVGVCAILREEFQTA